MNPVEWSLLAVIALSFTGLIIRAWKQSEMDSKE